MRCPWWPVTHAAGFCGLYQNGLLLERHLYTVLVGQDCDGEEITRLPPREAACDPQHQT